MTRLFKIAAFCSAALVVATVLLWIATFFVTPWDHRISFTRTFHAGVWSGPSGDTLGRLVVFNSKEHGPYRGGIIGIVSPDGSVYPQLDREVAWGDTLGVYYRYFRWPDGRTLWTLMVSLWYPLLAFALLPFVWLVRGRHMRLKVCRFGRTKASSQPPVALSVLS